MTKLRNKFEKRISAQLKKSKVPFSYETERIAYVLAKHYVPDFIVRTSSGTMYIECKGYFRPEDRAKLAAVKRQYPNRDFRIVFFSRSRSNIRWAERHGFKYSIEKIPEEWLT